MFLSQIPRERYVLGTLPTPVHRWELPGLPESVEVWIKRDDLTGMQLSGNKVRKLEFLLAEAKSNGHDCVVTIGGIQSNHCRATAVAARYLGMDCHVILRNSRAEADSDPRLIGNLLVERLVGAHIHQVTKEEYARAGSEALTEQLRARLEAEGRRPYVIPVGGSNPLGCWGYLEAVREMQPEAERLGITDVAMVSPSCARPANPSSPSRREGRGSYRRSGQMREPFATVLSDFPPAFAFRRAALHRDGDIEGGGAEVGIEAVVPAVQSPGAF